MWLYFQEINRTCSEVYLLGRLLQPRSHRVTGRPAAYFSISSSDVCCFKQALFTVRKYSIASRKPEMVTFRVLPKLKVNKSGGFHSGQGFILYESN